MGRSFGEQSSFSDRAFREIVWPEIAGMCGGGKLKSLELTGSELDLFGGVDVFQLFRTGVRTIAQRTQRASVGSFRTFTIRETTAGGGPTELQKRLDALQRGNDLPTLTVQAYVSDRGLVCAGVAMTRQLVSWVARHRDRLPRGRNGDDGNRFIIVPWYDLSAHNARHQTPAAAPFATWDALCWTRSPDDFFAGQERWI